jgi:hypothetical protein
LDLATSAVREIAVVHKDLNPVSTLRPGLRLSLSPDGKRILYPTYKFQTSLWMLEGFQRPGWMRWQGRILGQK